MPRGVPAARFRQPQQEATIHPIRSKRQILADMDDNQAACRASGQGHDWPRLRPGKPVPRGIRHDLQEDGCYVRTDTCSCCGKKRYRLTLPKGVYDSNAIYWYDDPPNWIRIPRSANITRADIAAEVNERMAPLLFGRSRG